MGFPVLPRDVFEKVMVLLKITGSFTGSTPDSLDAKCMLVLFIGCL